MRFSYLYLLVFSISFSFCNLSEKKVPSKEKINGISFVGPSKYINATSFNSIQRIHANWVVLMPFAYLQANNNPNLTLYPRWQWWGESPKGIRHCLSYAKQIGIKTMIKPQMWITDGTFTGHYALDTEEKWKRFETSYRTYILDYARMADSMNVDMLCIGTELNTFASQRPLFWKKLIRDIKHFYKGKLTYAENWDAYQNVSFWNELDYIGIDAYFPLSELATPSVEVLNEKWAFYTDKLKAYSQSINKKILFTEYGYRNIDHTTDKPWESYTKKPINAQAQANAYEALYQSLWGKEWFAGGFCWKWFDYDHNISPESNDSYSPQHKEAERVIANYYKQYTAN